MFSLRKSLFSLANLSALMLLTVGVQAQTTWHVALNGSGDFTSIQAAINATNAGDTILVAAGTYHESLVWENKDLTIQGAGAGQSIIDSGGRCLATQNLTTASDIEGFTFQGGQADLGAGMYNDKSSPTVANCAFSGNAAAYAGGAMGNAFYSCPTVINCTFDSNQASATVGLYGGGGMWNYYYCNPTVINCTFTHNSATSAGGGGMCNVYSSPSVTNCNFSLNESLDYADGGGMSNWYNSNPSVTNCIFSLNFAFYFGGGLYNNLSSAIVTNCTFSRNLAELTGGGISNDGDGLIVTNSIFWDNHGPGGVDGIDTEYGSATITYTDLQDLSNTTPDANGNFSADPLFVRNPFTNGTDDYGDLHLQAGSPCINSGNNTVVAAPPFLMDPTNSFLIDLDGNPRIKWGTVDLGAYEYQNNLAPTANAGSNQTVSATHTGNPANDTASVTLDGSASSDPDGDSLTYAWDDGQGHTATGVSPTVNLPVGAYTFTLTVTDPGGFNSSASVTVTVNPAPNAAPSLTVPATAAVDVGCPVNLQASATDPDGDTLTYSLASGPAWAGINASTGLVTLNPPPGTSGSFSVTVKATDPYGASDQKNVSVTVCPILISGVTISRQNKTVTVQFTLSNTDGTIVSNVSLNSATLKLLPTNSALPIVYAQLKQGVVKQVQFKFQNVASGPAQFLVNGTSSAGPVNANLSVTVP